MNNLKFYKFVFKQTSKNSTIVYAAMELNPN